MLSVSKYTRLAVLLGAVGVFGQDGPDGADGTEGAQESQPPTLPTKAGCFYTSGPIPQEIENVDYVSDESRRVLLTQDHEVVSIEECHSDTALVGLRWTMGIFTEAGDSWEDEVQMKIHGRLDQEDDPAVTCSQTELTSTTLLDAWDIFVDPVNLQINALKFRLTDDTIIEAGENFEGDTVIEFGYVTIDREADNAADGPIQGFKTQAVENEDGITIIKNLRTLNFSPPCLQEYEEDLQAYNDYQAEQERLEQERQEEILRQQQLLEELKNQAEAGETPTQCFETDTLQNDRGAGVPILSDINFFNLLTVDHVITQIKVCWNDRQIVGLQTTYGVWGNAGPASELVQMESHGTLDFDGLNIPNLSSYQCEQLDLGRGESVSNMLIYRTQTVFKRMSISKSNVLRSFGLSLTESGVTNDGLINFGTRDDIYLGDFYGFASQEGPEDVDVVDSLAPIRYDQPCFDRYYGFKQDKEDRDAAAAAAAQEAEEERLRREQELREQEEAEESNVTETEPEEEEATEGVVTEEPTEEPVTQDDDSSGGSGGAVAIVIILLLIIGLCVWIYFGDKCGCCLKKQFKSIRKCCKSCWSGGHQSQTANVVILNESHAPTQRFEDSSRFALKDHDSKKKDHDSSSHSSRSDKTDEENVEIVSHDFMDKHNVNMFSAQTSSPPAVAIPQVEEHNSTGAFGESGTNMQMNVTNVNLTANVVALQRAREENNDTAIEDTNRAQENATTVTAPVVDVPAMSSPDPQELKAPEAEFKLEADESQAVLKGQEDPVDALLNEATQMAASPRESAHAEEEQKAVEQPVVEVEPVGDVLKEVATLEAVDPVPATVNATVSGKIEAAMEEPVAEAAPVMDTAEEATKTVEDEAEAMVMDEAEKDKIVEEPTAAEAPAAAVEPESVLEEANEVLASQDEEIADEAPVEEEPPAEAEEVSEQPIEEEEPPEVEEEVEEPAEEPIEEPVEEPIEEEAPAEED